MSDEKIVLNPKQRNELIELLWPFLKKDKLRDAWAADPRVQTGWGVKTETGLLGCIEAIINKE